MQMTLSVYQMHEAWRRIIGSNGSPEIKKLEEDQDIGEELGYCFVSVFTIKDDRDSYPEPALFWW